MISVRHLEIFAAVMRAGSVTGAATLLNMTQPAASKLLRQAEEQIGITLFLRVRGRLVPTSQARSLFPDVEKVFSVLETVRRHASSLRETGRGSLSIVSIPSLSLSLLPDAIARFRKKNPLATVAVQVVPMQQIIDMVVGETAELGLLYGPAEHPALVADDLSATQIVCVLPRDHPLARKSAIGIADLAGLALIGSAPTQPFGRLLSTLFEACGGRYQPRVEAANALLACALVDSGEGIAVVDGLALSHVYPALVRRPLEPAYLLRPLAVYTRYRPPSRLATRFLRDLAAAARSAMSQEQVTPGSEPPADPGLSPSPPPSGSSGRSRRG